MTGLTRFEPRMDQGFDQWMHGRNGARAVETSGPQTTKEVRMAVSDDLTKLAARRRKPRITRLRPRPRPRQTSRPTSRTPAQWLRPRPTHSANPPTQIGTEFRLVA